VLQEYLCDVSELSISEMITKPSQDSSTYQARKSWGIILPESVLNIGMHAAVSVKIGV